MSQRILLVFVVSVLAPLALTAANEPLDFNRDIRPILSSVCIACHGPDDAAREAGLRLDTHEGATEDLGGYAAVVPGDATASEMLARIKSDDDDVRMPPPGKGRPLNADEIRKLELWIESGAQYASHWSYTPPIRRPLPEVKANEWVRSDIDRWVLKGVENAGLAPSPEADRSTLARRVSLALTGLPPEEADLNAFLNDTQPNAYERFVDAQLKRPAFGERWARVWLDLARYADSAGYADDPTRTIWAYRDYVIRSLNENKPFDQFTIEQIAGDLLDSPTSDQLIATAFHRNTMTNNEGGTNDEQFRNEAIVDRVNTTMAVWMGTTMACAQCHTHKYDPITQEEYFQFFDFFNQTADADRRDESPLLDVWTEEQLERKRHIAQEIERLQLVLTQQTPELDTALDQWLSTLREPPQWEPLEIAVASSDQAKLDTDVDNWVRLAGERPATATYQVEVPLTSNQHVAAIRLEVPESQTTNFVLSRFAANWQPQDHRSISAQHVRIQVPGTQKFLHIAELEVFQNGKNIASQAKVSQSSTAYDASASRAIDGNTDGNFYANSVTHTNGEDGPWLELDFGQPVSIDAVAVWNRTDGGQPIMSRITGYRIELLNAERKVVHEQTPSEIPAPMIRLDLSGQRALSFASAAADYSQDGFPATAALADTDPAQAPKPDTGWAVAGQTGKPHAIEFYLNEVIELAKGTLSIQLDQQSKFSEHVLTSFRLSTTSDERATEWGAMPAAIRTLVAKESLEPTEREQVASYFRTITPLLSESREGLKRLEQEQSQAKPHTTVPIQRELAADKQRKTFIQLRGNYQSLGAQVTANVPAAFHPLPNDAPRNRLTLAKWLVDPANPLTPRVIVNRHWEELFGTGIVETSEEFGSQGDLPSHPELLDWLSLDLVESGWDLKLLLKQMVMSATYRQSSAVTPELLEVDPANRLYARGPRFRVSAEMVRDQSLAVAGLLSPRMYGEPVRPVQPQLGLSAAFGSGTDWKTSDGEDRYRRAIYTTWRRSNPYPSMATFDAPNREVCTLRRSRTNTPLQALVTLNDPVYVEAAQSLARKMTGANDLKEQLALGLRACLVRQPKANEVERLEALYQQTHEHFTSHPADAKKFAENPIGPLPDGLDPVHVASLTVVANVLLNLDEFLMPQ